MFNNYYLLVFFQFLVNIIYQYYICYLYKFLFFKYNSYLVIFIFNYIFSENHQNILQYNLYKLITVLSMKQPIHIYALFSKVTLHIVRNKNQKIKKQSVRYF